MKSNWQQYRNSAQTATAEGKLDQAETMWLAAMEEAKDFGQTDPRYSETLEALANVLYMQKKYADAEPLVRNVLLAKCFENEARPGSQHKTVGLLSHKLAVILMAQGKALEAESSYKRALELLHKALGSDHPQVISVLDEYAQLLTNTHRQAEAEHLKTCIQGLQSGRWTESGRWEVIPREGEALSQVKDSKRINNSPTSGIAAAAVRKAAKITGTMPALRPELHIRTADGAPSGRLSEAAASTTGPLKKIDSTQVTAAQSTKKPAPAKIEPDTFDEGDEPEIAPRVAPAPEATVVAAPTAPVFAPPPPTSPEDAWHAFSRYAADAQQKEFLDISEQLWRMALRAAEATGSGEKTSTALDALGENLLRQKKYPESEQLLLKSLDIKEKQIGKQDLRLAQTLNTLAQLYYSTGNVPNAIPITHRCLQLYEHNYGESNLHVATTAYNLGILHHVQKDFDQADELYRKSFRIRSELLGERHPDTLKAMKNLSILVLNRRSIDAANRLKRDVNVGTISGTWKAMTVDRNAQLHETPES